MRYFLFFLLLIDYTFSKNTHKCIHDKIKIKPKKENTEGR